MLHVNVGHGFRTCVYLDVLTECFLTLSSAGPTLQVRFPCVHEFTMKANENSNLKVRRSCCMQALFF